jgi:tRNA(fMet)-specific endonuclease VapC
MLRCLLDTNLCIRVVRERPASLRERSSREADDTCISTIVLTELLHGAAQSARPEHNRREVENFAARLEVLAFDSDAAGHARSRGLIVLTGHLGEFRHVAGLRCEDWS